MKTGIFCNYENYHQDTRRAIEEQVSLVKYAQTLDFEEAWVAERHFNDFNLSPSILVLLAHLAGMTSTYPVRLSSSVASRFITLFVSPKISLLLIIYLKED